ncbi:MAG: prepilin-type N-terminal cleavage/methylation domain-containing protein [Leptolyngbya sp. PLA3]|nr:MAG: prepilin-type N-terminal cleavage/methylation domain-containing protein [Cyanobacteria bacterium CYA]MCE7969036.1 prepilin-type N-terminal cleavage/methylation domain-containing protein [Leptolyngbya sp. PL-A3]
MRWMKAGERAFTLVEVLIVVIIIGVLAAVVVPRFAGATDEARTSSLQSVLGGVRSSIASFRTRAVIAGEDPFPTLGELTTTGSVLQNEVPANPFTGVSGVQSVSLAQAQSRAVVNENAAGWNYAVDNESSPPVAIFYANCDNASSVEDSEGNAVTANEL